LKVAVFAATKIVLNFWRFEGVFVVSRRKRSARRRLNSLDISAGLMNHTVMNPAWVNILGVLAIVLSMTPGGHCLCWHFEQHCSNALTEGPIQKSCCKDNQGAKPEKSSDEKCHCSVASDYTDTSADLNVPAAPCDAPMDCISADMQVCDYRPNSDLRPRHSQIPPGLGSYIAHCSLRI
jgi:hypothetical protein